MNPPYRGSCLCGVITFEIDAFLPNIAHCHCQMCRKFHGASHATLAAVKTSEFRWMSGEKALKTYTAENETTRTFCHHCGSSLSFLSPRASSDVIEIAVAAMDDDVPIEPDAHIFTDYGANWSAPCDELPKFREGRSSRRIDE